MPTVDTGLRPLPDGGKVVYNGVYFSALYHSQVTGSPEWDRGHRTVKYMKWSFYFEGVVLLPFVPVGPPQPGRQDSIDTQWMHIRKLLDQPAGTFSYQNKGFGPFLVNKEDGSVWDSAWGPMPETLEFVPLGASRSAFIRWRVTVNLPEFYNSVYAKAVLSWDTSMSIDFGEDDYGTYTYRGAIEIPMTRKNVDTGIGRTMPDSIEAYRQAFTDPGIPDQYRPVRRGFNISDDKRTVNFEYVYEELPAGGFMPGALPKNATDARGSYRVSSMPGKGFVRWQASLRASYTIRKDVPRRTAYLLFIGLLRSRMSQAKRQFLPLISAATTANFDIFTRGATAPIPGNNFQNVLTCIMVSFSVDEGLYLDSKSVSFEATWTLASNLANMLQASGVWKAVPDTDWLRWKTNIAPIMGPNNWDKVALNTIGDLIIDIGKPMVPPAQG